MDYAQEIARAGLKIQAIKLSPAQPFTWASGLRMPIYNDNRLFLFQPEYRKLLAQGFAEILRTAGIPFEVIAGTSTAGISPATTLADYLGKPLIYVRNKPKDHGLKNQIEGLDADTDLQGKKVVLVEDLISTGGSSARAVEAIRAAQGTCDHCLAIFSYGLAKATQTFGALEPPCAVHPLLTYDTLLAVAKATGYIDDSQVGMLAEWREDPLNWGKKNGFPPEVGVMNSKDLKISVEEKKFMLEAFLYAISNIDFRPEYYVVPLYLRAFILELIIKIFYELDQKKPSKKTHNILEIFQNLNDDSKKFIESKFNEVRKNNIKKFETIDKAVIFHTLEEVLKSNHVMVTNFKYDGKFNRLNPSTNDIFYKEILRQIKDRVKNL